MTAAQTPLGAVVADAMERRGMSTRDVEKHGGPPYSTTARIINPAVKWRRPPGDDTLAKLAKALRLPLARLQQATAETLGWPLDLSLTPQMRTVIAAMGALRDDAQTAVADITLIVAEQLRLAAA